MEKHSAYNSFKKFVRVFWKLAGFWAYKEGNENFWGQKLICPLSLVISTFISLSALNFTIHNFTNVATFAIGLGPLMSYMTIFLKTLSFIIYRREFYEVDKSLNKIFESNLESTSEKHAKFTNLRFIIKNAKIYTYMVAFVTASFPFTSMLQFLRHRKYILPLPSRFPWNFSKGGYLYWMHWSIECCAGFNMWCISVATEVTFIFQIFKICGILRNSKLELQNIYSGEWNHPRRRRCIMNSALLIHHNRSMQKLIGVQMIFSNIGTALIICSLMYQINQLQQLPMIAILRVLLYITSKSIQLLMYSWSGDALQSASLEFYQAAYYCAWTGTENRRMKHDITIILSQRPMRIRIIGYFNVTLLTSLSVLHAAVSYYFLLKSFEK